MHEVGELIITEHPNKSLKYEVKPVERNEYSTNAKTNHNHLDKAIANLLTNTEHEGTVVRWSTAFALGEILKLKTKHNTELFPVIENICEREEKNSIKKIYSDAIKETKK